ncbi:33544_t:CDS:1, partial [Racocetra persica]
MTGRANNQDSVQTFDSDDENNILITEVVVPKNHANALKIITKGVSVG